MRRLSTHQGRLVYGFRIRPPSFGRIILLHGFASSGRFFDAAWQATTLADWGLLVPDLPGFGASPALDGPEIFAPSCALLLELLEPLEEPLVLVGVGTGGNLALAIADSLPKITGLAALDTPLLSWDAEDLADAALCDDPGDWLRGRIQALSRETTPQANQQLARLMQADPMTCRRLAREVLERLAGDEAARLASLRCRRAWWQSEPCLAASHEAAQSRAIPTLLGLPAPDVEPAPLYAHVLEFCQES